MSAKHNWKSFSAVKDLMRQTNSTEIIYQLWFASLRNIVPRA